MKFLSHAAAALLEGALVATVILVLVVGTTFAAKPSSGSGGGGGHKGGGGTTSGGSGTIALHYPLVVDNNGNGAPNWGDVVSFDISTTATSSPYVHLMCSQNGTMVAQGWDGYFDGALGGRTFGLSSPVWTSGAASCKANLETGSGAVLASTTFSVGA
jgi:hypothetical protein